MHDKMVAIQNNRLPCTENIGDSVQTDNELETQSSILNNRKDPKSFDGSSSREKETTHNITNSKQNMASDEEERKSVDETSTSQENQLQQPENQLQQQEATSSKNASASVQKDNKTETTGTSENDNASLKDANRKLDPEGSAPTHEKPVVATDSFDTAAETASTESAAKGKELSSPTSDPVENGKAAKNTTESSVSTKEESVAVKEESTAATEESNAGIHAQSTEEDTEKVLSSLPVEEIGTDSFEEKKDASSDEADQTERKENAQTMNGNSSKAVDFRDDTHSVTTNTSRQKIPVDASGICSLEKEEASDDPEDTVNRNNNADKPAADSPTRALASSDLRNALVGEEETNSSGKIYNGETNVSSKPQLSPELLANKGKEGFGLMVRGESFREQQKQQQQSRPESRQSDQLKQQLLDQQQQQFLEQVNLLPRVPLEPDALHKRKESSIRNLPMPLDEVEVTAGSTQLDDNSNRPLDDNSWRPSQHSYPPSPQAVPHPQAMPYGNTGYMIMPTHQGQPPAFIQPPMMHQTSFNSSHHSQLLGRASYGYSQIAPVPAMAPMPAPGGKRKIKLKLQEEILARPTHGRRKSFFFGARSTRNLTESVTSPNQPNEVDRGTITVSWFEGTSSTELQDHVNRSVSRKLKLDNDQRLDDVRILDTKVDPPEEIVLCPFIPNGSEFVLRYKLKPASGQATPTFYGPPDSPSAAPSPFPHGHIGSLDASQLASLRKQLDAVQGAEQRKAGRYRKSSLFTPMRSKDQTSETIDETKTADAIDKDQGENKQAMESDMSDGDGDNESEATTLQPESSVDAKLRQITELLLMDKQAQQQRHQYPKVEKRQVIFVLANYLVLFFVFITIMAEIQARAPNWLSWMETQLENVQNCSADQEALFKCVQNGEFAGLFATVILWLSRSATTKRLFLLGFDSPEKLWTVFYESLVGAFCWGCSYMFIRRGMNPDTRPNFLQKYWKDCLYGSLAGFNATFMKSVLKNLIPKEAVEEAFNDRQLKILSWLPSFSH